MNNKQQFDFYWNSIFSTLPFTPIEFQTYRYDQSISLPEKLNKLYEMFQQLALNNQEIMDYLKQFVAEFDQNLYGSVDAILSQWLQDGVFDKLTAELILKVGDLDDFREFDPLLMQKIKNEFYERSINPKWFGAVGDGIADDTKAIQKAIDFCVKHILDPQISNRVEIPHGVYLVTETLVLPPYVKLATNGNVYLNASPNFRLGTPMIWVKWLGGGKDPQVLLGNSKPEYRVQQFMHDTLIDGTNGNLALTGCNVHMTALDNQYDNVDGIWIGNLENIGTNGVVARTFFSGLMLSNLNRAIAIAKHDTFILTFDRVHIERTYICFDDHIANEQSFNNGENQVLLNCILSNSHICFMKDFFVSCYGCSFDFNKTIFYSENGYTGLQQFISGGHIEGDGSISKTNASTYSLVIHGTRIYLKNRNEYDQLFIGKATISLVDIYWSGNTTKENYFDTLSLFIADPNIRLKISSSLYANSITQHRPLFNKRTNYLNHTESGVVNPTISSRPNVQISKIETGNSVFKSLNINQTIKASVTELSASPTGWFTITLPKVKLSKQQQIAIDGFSRVKIPDRSKLYHNYTYRFYNENDEKTEIKKYGTPFALSDVESIVRFDSVPCDVPQDAESVIIEIGVPFEVVNQLNFEYELGALFIQSDRF